MPESIKELITNLYETIVLWFQDVINALWDKAE